MPGGFSQTTVVSSCRHSARPVSPCRHASPLPMPRAVTPWRVRRTRLCPLSLPFPTRLPPVSLSCPPELLRFRRDCRARRRRLGPPRVDRSGREGSPCSPLPPHRRIRAGVARVRRNRPRPPRLGRAPPADFPDDSAHLSTRRPRLVIQGELSFSLAPSPAPLSPSRR